MEAAKQHPATYTLAALWVAVYVAMTWFQGGIRTEGGLLGFGAIAPETALTFGALTAKSFAAGQVWRAVMATFIHFSLLHMILNMTCLFAFGRALETWYGGPIFFGVYVLIAAVGNALAVAGRFAMSSGLSVPCAGGSSVMFGLIAMIAVVGWRSKTRYGDYMRRQMVGMLIFYGVIMGFALRGILDNYGHGGGALAGAALGFSHRLLLKGEARPAIARAFGLAGAIVLAACAAAQAMTPRPVAEGRLVTETRIVEAINFSVENLPRANREQAAVLVLEIRRDLALLDLLPARPNSRVDRGLSRRWRTLAMLSTRRLLTRDELVEFHAVAGRLLSQMRADLKRANARPSGKEKG